MFLNFLNFGESIRVTAELFRMSLYKLRPGTVLLRTKEPCFSRPSSSSNSRGQERRQAASAEHAFVRLLA